MLDMSEMDDPILSDYDRPKLNKDLCLFKVHVGEKVTVKVPRKGGK